MRATARRFEPSAPSDVDGLRYGPATDGDTSGIWETRDDRLEKRRDAVTSWEWTRRDLIRGLARAALAAALPLVARGAGADGSAPAAVPRDREARRRWALARMDEMAQERLRCHERFREPRDVRQCQVEFERRHRAYNEIYVEATRE
jgi:hypothetical protein